MKRISAILISAAVVAAPVLAGSTAFAQSTSDEPIRSGLWQAYDLIFGSSQSGTTTGTPESKPAAQTAKPKSDKRIYAALGDSVAAGAGLPAKTNPVGNDTRCGRSSQGYGYTVAREAGLPILFVPCSGATAGDLFTQQGVTGKNIKAQLTRAYEAGRPELITITAGANDARWNFFIRECGRTNCATQNYTDASRVAQKLAETNLRTAMRTIQLRSGSDLPQVILTGYYNPVSDACAARQTAITSAEIAWITTETEALNRMLAEVADRYTFVDFAPVDFTGHDLCADEPWVQGLADTAPAHPTVEGQQEIARSVIAQLR